MYIYAIYYLSCSIVCLKNVFLKCVTLFTLYVVFFHNNSLYFFICSFRFVSVYKYSKHVEIYEYILVTTENAIEAVDCNCSLRLTSILVVTGNTRQKQPTD